MPDERFMRHHYGPSGYVPLERRVDIGALVAPLRVAASVSDDALHRTIMREAADALERFARGGQT